METARIKAISVLGYNFGLHVLRSLIPGKKPDQAELFRKYFIEDRIAPFTAAEHLEMARFEGCLSCGLCPAHCRVMEISQGRFLGPMHVAAAGRSQPDLFHDADNIVLCAACGQCEPVCPEDVPVADMVRAMRSMIWRVAPEALPRAYHQARENLQQSGSVYGPGPKLDLPPNPGAGACLVLGPALRQDPDKARRLAELLAKAGYDLAAAEEGSIGGVAEAMGLEPDTSWVDRLAKTKPKLVIVADPEAWIALKNDDRLKDKSIKFALEALADKLPPDLDLAPALPGPAAVHDSYPLCRRSTMDLAIRQTLEKRGARIVDMDLDGGQAPPLGWEGGLELVAPDLGLELARARIRDARAAGAKALVSASARDVEIIERAEGKKGFPIYYLFDIIHEAYGLT